VNVRWTAAALDDLAAIVAYYLEAASPWTAEVVRQRILAAIIDLRDFPERARRSERVPGTRELVVPRLPYLVFVRIAGNDLIILNVVHTARRFP